MRRTLTSMRQKHSFSLAISTLTVVAVLVLVALAATLTSGDDAQGYDRSSKSRHSDSRSSLGRLYYSSFEPSRRSAETPGCGIEHIEGYSSGKDHHSLDSGGIMRYYTVEVPPGYNHDKTRPWPLILDFHGASRTSKDQYNNSRYFSAVGGEKYVVVYPQGRGNVWEGAEYSIEGVKDIEFVADLLNHLELSYCIDKNRIYASGKSNGGGFIDMLACSDEGDNFAAFAMASAALYSDDSVENTKLGGCSKSRAILESHGGLDKTTPYEGQAAGEGDRGATPAVKDWLGWWARRDGCEEGQGLIIDNDHEGYSITSYSCGGYHEVVQGYYIPELDHCWPSADGKNSDAGTRKEGCSFHGLDFTSVALNWFGRWDRNNAPQN